MLSKLIKNVHKEPLATVLVGDQQLKLVRTRRKSSIALKAKPDGVAVLVPKHLSNRQLTRLLNQHQIWLEQSLQGMEQRLQNRVELPGFTGQEGDSFEWLGHPRTVYHQRVSIAPSGRKKLKPYAMLNETSCLLHICRHDRDFDHSVACQTIETHLKREAHQYLEPRLQFYAEQIGVDYQSLTVKGYKSRWGSCYPDGRIQFNWRLLQAPSWVVDYVVVHELCHRVHANHSKAFWTLVERHYPATAEAKSYIKRHGARWIQFLQ